MYSKHVTVETLTKMHGSRAADVFNEISALGGYGIRATDFAGHDGGLAVNDTTPNLDKIKALIEAKTETKEGK